MRTTIIATIILSLMLLSCQDTKPVVTLDPYVGGSEGLRMEFIEGAPPDETFDNSKGQFAISLRLHNVGEHDIEPDDGYIELLGINPIDFNKQSQSDLLKFIDVPLRAAKKNVEGTLLEGGETILQVASLKYLPDLHGTDTQTIRADLCYDYKTKSTTKICVKRDLLRSLTRDEVCDVSGDKDPKNSGGPIQITTLKENPLGDGSVQVIFEVEHVGNPQNYIYRPGRETICDQSVDNYPNKNLVHVRVTSMVNQRRPQCSGLEEPDADGAGGFLRLYQGRKRAVTCTLDIKDVEAIYQELFEVELDYKYHQYLEKDLIIRDIG
jgi:hypothetical protein